MIYTLLTADVHRRSQHQHRNIVQYQIRHIILVHRPTDDLHVQRIRSVRIGRQIVFAQTSVRQIVIDAMGRR